MRALALLALVGAATAQFGSFFDQMFGGPGEGQGGRQQRQQNVASDASAYQHHFESSHCDKYLCPDTLACVHFPHHCPCAWSDHEDKFEFGEGSRICASKGGFKQKETARKVELARKGML